MLCVAISVGLAVGLLLLGLVVVPWTWSLVGERKSSGIHRGALERCASDEIRARALEFLSNDELSPSSFVEELRRRLEHGDYRWILRHWRSCHSALAEAYEARCKREPNEEPFPTWILKDYVVTLDARKESEG